MRSELNKYKKEMLLELESILAYWSHYTVDEQNGGFIGKIDRLNRSYPSAEKGSVLNSRILWSFSSAYNLTANKEYLQLAERAFKYISDHFIDREFGGVYWSLNYKGAPLDTRKQIYALSFAIYGFSEYFIASRDEEAKELAIGLYQDIIRYSYDQTYGGYIEALARDWKDIDDLRLSAKDANERKSMNTHLHVLEGFANLYRIWPDNGLKQRITELIFLFLDYIIDQQTNHLGLFFDDRWLSKSQAVSYGHDIEAAWLVQEAAEVIGDEELIHQVKSRSLLVAEAAARGLDSDGGLWYEMDPRHGLVKEKHWWPQAEAMVGFFNAWQISNNPWYLKNSINSWEFVQNHLLDNQTGEWHWGVLEDYSVMTGEDKVGLWKCPYHNSRACIELIRRISEIEKNDLLPDHSLVAKGRPII